MFSVNLIDGSFYSVGIISFDHTERNILLSWEILSTRARMPLGPSVSSIFVIHTTSAEVGHSRPINSDGWSGARAT